MSSSSTPKGGMSAAEALQQNTTLTANTYEVNEGMELSQASQRATTEHLFAAADFIAQVFTANEIRYALMGGFNMVLRGSPRETHDVDIAVGCTMLELKETFNTKAEGRVRFPLRPTSGVLRIYVKTLLETNTGFEDVYVKVDLVLRGSLGAPDDPESSSEILTFKDRSYPVLNIESLMSSKLGAYFGRTEDNDYMDILYLLTKYPEEVHGVRAKLNLQHRNFFVENLTRNAKDQSVKKAKYVLGIAT